MIIFGVQEHVSGVWGQRQKNEWYDSYFHILGDMPGRKKSEVSTHIASPIQESKRHYGETHTTYLKHVVCHKESQVS